MNSSAADLRRTQLPPFCQTQIPEDIFDNNVNELLDSLLIDDFFRRRRPQESLQSVAFLRLHFHYIGETARTLDKSLKHCHHFHYLHFYMINNNNNKDNCHLPLWIKEFINKGPQTIRRSASRTVSSYQTNVQQHYGMISHGLLLEWF